MDLIRIQEQTIPEPSEFMPGIYYIKEASRGGNGTLKQKVIAKKRKLECTWAYLTGEQMKFILDLCDNNGSDSVFIRYYDAQAKAIRTGQFYTNDRLPKMWRFINDNAEYLSFSLSFIEF